jgi:hypothetical protein
VGSCVAATSAIKARKAIGVTAELLALSRFRCRARPDGLVFVGEKGAPLRHTSFGRKWRPARAVVCLPDGFRFYDPRHTGHTLSTHSGATLKDTMVRARQSSEKAALIYPHSDEERQREVATRCLCTAHDDARAGRASAMA